MIKIQDLCFSYTEDTKTIDHISLEINKGEYVAILGHNGSGKSTIAKLLIGLLDKQSGEIYINGLELNEKNLYKVRENVGIVFQNPDNQFIGSTVADDIAFGLENLCVPTEKMDEIILEFASKVNMQKFLTHEPTKLSGGQKQRVAIAGILAMAPNIIILDEATSMLDPKGKSDINGLVREINEQKDITIISITHDIEEAKYADRIILLNKGKVVQTGTPDEILSQVELLEELKLDIPFAYKISKGLKKQGYPVNEVLYEEAFSKELCQLRLKK